MGKDKSSKKEKHLRPTKTFRKLLKYATKGNAKKLEKLLQTPGSDPNVTDSAGQSLLHQACRCGQDDVVVVLLRHGANPRQQDRDGNTPAHVAATRGQLVALQHLLQGPNAPHIDCCNKRGESIRVLAEWAVSGLQHLGAPGAATPAAAAGHDAGGSALTDEDEEWRQRLREEDSDGEGAWGRGHDDGAWHGADMESEDEWANRMWREMQGRRRQQAAEAARLFSASLRNDAKERAEQQSRAKAESDRILREEMAKDAAYRRRALMGPEGPPAPSSLPEPGLVRAEYEAKWQVLDATAVQPGRVLRYSDMPWLPDAAIAGTSYLQEILLHGVSGPSDIKARLRQEIMRWHPDKFGSRFGARLDTEEKARILVRAKEMSQLVTQAMRSGGGG